MSSPRPFEPPQFPLSFSRIVLLTFLAVGGFLLVSEHWAHLVGYLPLLLLLGICLGMHLFMHGAHGHGPSDADGSSKDDPTGLPKEDEKS